MEHDELEQEAVEQEDGALEEVVEVNPFPRTECITGRAGTGKTFMVRERAEKHRGQVLCATTGIAAVNLGEGVTTLNSLIGFFDTASLKDMWTGGWLATKLMKLYRSGIRQIVLDEMSMMDGTQLTVLTAALDELNERLGDNEPGMGLTLTGDFCQLPPVKAPFAFEAEPWERYEKNLTLLTAIRRQTDLRFIEALGQARKGNGAGAVDPFIGKMQSAIDYNYSGVTLMARNDPVDRFNLLRMSQLKTEPVSFLSERWGTGRGEWKNIPETLTLKTTALVMILANVRLYDELGQPTGEYLYVNGDLGELVEVDQAAHVRLRRTGKLVQVNKVTRNHLQPLEPGRRKALRAIGEDWKIVCTQMGCKACLRGDGKCPNAKHEIIGQITYMPLRLAYATTVHKSQGLTMDQVQIDIRDAFFGSPGMLYVALSRCRSAEGIRLVGRSETFVGRCNTDPRIARWV